VFVVPAIMESAAASIKTIKTIIILRYKLSKK